MADQAAGPEREGSGGPRLFGLTIPNVLTFARLAMVGGVAAALEVPGGRWVALGLFLAASATDWFDGVLARKLDQITELGSLLDPLADKVLVAAALLGLTAHGVVPAWSVTLVLAREFLISGFRVLVAKEGTILPAGWSGKVKAFVQMGAIALLLAGIRPLGDWCYWVSVVLAVQSGVEYLWAGRALLKG